MTVKELIARLQGFNGDLPVALIEYPYSAGPVLVKSVHMRHVAAKQYPPILVVISGEGED